LQAQLTVPAPVDVHRAAEAQPPLLTEHPLTPEHFCPFPAYPVLQAQELVPGPVLVQVALGSHPP
jgi:hypothetical protein